MTHVCLRISWGNFELGSALLPWCEVCVVCSVCVCVYRCEDWRLTGLSPLLFISLKLCVNVCVRTHVFMRVCEHTHMLAYLEVRDNIWQLCSATLWILGTGPPCGNLLSHPVVPTPQFLRQVLSFTLLPIVFDLLFQSLLIYLDLQASK